GHAVEQFGPLGCRLPWLFAALRLAVRCRAAGDNRPSICQNSFSALGGVRHGSRVIAPGPNAARRDCKMTTNIDLDQERVLLDTLAKARRCSRTPASRANAMPQPMP